MIDPHDSPTLPPSSAHEAATLPPSPNDTTPHQEAAVKTLPNIPGFSLESELGRGGMGVVYLARQVRLNRLVALKMILSADHADADTRLRFLHEAETDPHHRNPPHRRPPQTRPSLRWPQDRRHRWLQPLDVEKELVPWFNEMKAKYPEEFIPKYEDTRRWRLNQIEDCCKEKNLPAALFHQHWLLAEAVVEAGKGRGK